MDSFYSYIIIYSTNISVQPDRKIISFLTPSQPRRTNFFFHKVEAHTIVYIICNLKGSIITFTLKHKMLTVSVTANREQASDCW